MFLEFSVENCDFEAENFDVVLEKLEDGGDVVVW